MKKCTKCSVEKPLEDFHCDKSTKDGKTYACKQCRTVQTVAWHKRTESWKSDSVKKSIKKRMEKPENKKRASHASTKWFHKNHEKTVPYNRANAALRRIMKYYPEAQVSEIKDVLSVYEEAYRLELETGIKHHVDHKRPLQGGGMHHIDNLEVLTEEQHARKTLNEYKIISKLLTEYYEKENNTDDSSAF